MKRIYLSSPHIGKREKELVHEALESNWIAPLGPQVDAFENEVRELVGTDYAVALSSGTAGLHLSLLVMGVAPGDTVLCSSLTFASSANAIKYCGGEPVFIDSEPASWNIDPALIEEELSACKRRGRLPKVVLAVDLYGQCADYEPLRSFCAEYDVHLVEDAAEALGARYGTEMAGTLGDIGIFSFNGNKIITTGGGGMVVTNNGEWEERIRHLATQARDPAPHYQHSTVGYNYRLSNILAAIGRAQLQKLERRVAARRRINQWYRQELGCLPGIRFLQEASYGKSNHWLTCITVDPELFGATRDDIRIQLEDQAIEARPVWKPMHLQPVFKECRFVGTGVSDRLFENGLCLPSGSSLEETDLKRITGAIWEIYERYC